MAWAFLGFALFCAWLAWNTYRPLFRPAPLAALSFLAGWLTSELAIFHIIAEFGVAFAFVYFGALEAWPGYLAAVLLFGGWALLALSASTAQRTHLVVGDALDKLLGGEKEPTLAAERDASTGPSRVHAKASRFGRGRRGVVRQKNIVFGEVGRHKLLLDVYRSADAGPKSPVLLQVHGGGWVLGSKNDQGIPIMRHMAARGWVCVNANYRLSPRATFPDHLIDLKRAVAWIRAHAADYGGDPDFVVVTGGSAGGHLAALLALTANDPMYQPGFESVDTSVEACIPFYGVYDFSDRFGIWPHQGLHRLLERRVMKTTRSKDGAAFERASPIARIHDKRPPFFVIHGDKDSLVPVEEARRFVAALRASGSEPVVYAELPGAQHAFDIFSSSRTRQVLKGVERFLGWLVERRKGRAALADEPRVLATAVALVETPVRAVEVGS